MTQSNDDGDAPATLDELRARADARRAAAGAEGFDVGGLVEKIRADSPMPSVDRMAPTLMEIGELSARAAEEAMAASQKMHAKRWRREDLAERNHKEEIAERAERARERAAWAEDRRIALEDRDRAETRAQLVAAERAEDRKRDAAERAEDRKRDKRRFRLMFGAALLSAGIAGTGLFVTLSRETTDVAPPTVEQQLAPPAPNPPTQAPSTEPGQVPPAR